MRKLGYIIILILIYLAGCSNSGGDVVLDWIPTEVTPATNQNTNSEREELLESDVKGDENTISYPVAGNVIVIGNSITLGFGTHGMASSAVNTDYYYLLQQYLLRLNPDVKVKRVAGYGWESSVTSEERVEFLEKSIKPELPEQCDLIIIQLGDNVNTPEKQATFETDTYKFLDWIKTECPNVRVLWVFGRYNLSNSEAIRKACELYGAEYVDISVISTDDKYKAKINSEYEKEDGTMGVITDYGVASHPNDEGMRVIFDKIVEKLNYEEEE